ncbi:MAG TPA: hypothetical protein VMZ53_11340 [Kofleriaceae bacterium]|nr:hypothetical protein [Kofleriaceae bacterium]
MRTVVVAAVLTALTSVAAAQAPGETMSWPVEEAAPSTTTPEPQTVTVSYRRDILIADGLAVGAIFLGPLGDNEELTGWGMVGYMFAAPVVHIAHGRGVTALQSLGLRAGLPLLGAYVGYNVGPDDAICVESVSGYDGPSHSSCGGDGSLVGMILGGMAGGVTAMVLDAKYLAKYEKRTAPTWSASIKPARGGLSLGVSGTF